MHLFAYKNVKHFILFWIFSLWFCYFCLLFLLNFNFSTNSLHGWFLIDSCSFWCCYTRLYIYYYIIFIIIHSITNNNTCVAFALFTKHGIYFDFLLLLQHNSSNFQKYDKDHLFNLTITINMQYGHTKNSFQDQRKLQFIQTVHMQCIQQQTEDFFY